MKFFSTLLLLVISTQVLGADINYEVLTQRYVTSVKEAQVDAQFGQMPEVKQCVDRFPITDVSNQDAIRTAQANTAQCMRDLFKDVPEGRLTELSNQLQLDAYGVVKGKSNADLVNYLASRMEKALYGMGPNGEVKKLKDQNLVDQKVFVDIYETQVGKNILLEISNYCYTRLNIAGASGATRISAIAALTTAATDSGVRAATITDKDDLLNVGSGSIYDAVKTDLESFTNSSGPKALGRFFEVCTAVIPKMCENYESCLCQFKKKTDPTLTCPTTPLGCTAPPATEPENGRYSCHVAARLKGYRTNLMAIEKTKDRFNDIKEENGTFRVNKDLVNVYDKANAGKDESFDALTSFTTSEAETATKSQEMATAASGIDAEECSRSPENPECAKFYYNGSEVQRFAQSSAGYTAATIVEAEKIKKLEADKPKLLEYLNSRAYFDIAKKLEDGTINEQQAVADAKARFETEREATFKEMTAAFERKQFTTDLGSSDDKERRAAEVQQEYQNKGKEFQQLILFNNVVSSYLQLRRVGANGQLESAGLNLTALNRENERAASVADAQGSLSYFQNLTTGETSTLQDSDTPVVNIDFLDTILGKDVPAATGTGAAGPGTAPLN